MNKSWALKIRQEASSNVGWAYKKIENGERREESNFTEKKSGRHNLSLHDQG